MNLLSLLKKAAKSEIATYTRFLQQYNPQGNEIHVFHEGDDDPSFYGNYIERLTKENQAIRYYNCRNKQNVYDQYSKINWRSFEKTRLIFLVDKDMADILNLTYPVDSNIFVTTYYSIENYLVTATVFARCLRELLSVDDSTINVFNSPFRRALKRFYSGTLIISSYIVFHRQLGTKINLNNLSIKDIFDMKDPFNPIIKLGRIATLDTKFRIETGRCFRPIKEITAKLKNIDEPKKYVRGKYELEFFVALVNHAITLLNQGNRRKKYKMPVSLSKSNAVRIIAPRLRLPKDIATFLDQNLK